MRAIETDPIGAMFEEHPYTRIAIPEFLRQFGSLISVRAEFGDYEVCLIASVKTQLFNMSLTREEQKHIDETVRAAHFYLDRGAQKNPRLVCESYLNIANKIPEALNRAHHKNEMAFKSSDLDKRIDALLDLYKTQYEGVFSLIAAPVIVGFGQHYNSNETKFEPKTDGRIDLKAIELMEDWLQYPSNRLREGLNRHIRNAHAHERYRILDGGRIEIWDTNPRGEPVWGPEIWTAEKIKALCRQLELTILGVVLALALLGVNYRKVIVRNGWLPKESDNPPHRFEYSKKIVDLFAETNSFVVSSFEKNGTALQMKLQTKHRGSDHDEEYLVGGKGWAKTYKRPVKYIEALLIEGVMGMIQRAAATVSDVDSFIVEVSNEEGLPLGMLEISRAALSKVKGPTNGTIEEDRKQAAVDTLGDQSMWLKTSGPVSE